jgi:hypothetical protein
VGSCVAPSIAQRLGLCGHADRWSRGVRGGEHAHRLVDVSACEEAGVGRVPPDRGRQARSHQEARAGAGAAERASESARGPPPRGGAGQRASCTTGETLRWANPILGAVGDLRARLGNILNDGAYVALDPRWDPKSNPSWSISYDYFMCSTLYLFANYFARTRMLEETLSFELFNSQAEKDQLFGALRSVSKALGSYPPRYACSGLDVQVFRLQQRALGELIIRRENNKDRCWTYPEFVDGMKKAEVSAHFASLQQLPERVGPDDECRWKRLIETNRALQELDAVCRDLLDLPEVDAAPPAMRTMQPGSGQLRE